MSHGFPDVAAGSRVRHATLGEGVVVGSGADAGYVAVYFLQYGERQVRPADLVPAEDAWGALVRGMKPATEDSLRAMRLGLEALALPGAGAASAASTAAKIDLLPHQIVLVHRIANADPRRFLVADEVGLGKTIETALVLRELASRGELRRAMMIVPAGLVENWRHELNDVFRLDFEIFGAEGDVSDRHSNAFARHNRLIASVDTLKQPRRTARILAAPPWDLIVFDEAHHLSAFRSGRKTVKTLNYRLAEALRGHTRDLLLLSATPHQGDHFRFWMLVRLLYPDLFTDVDDMLENRHRLNAAVIRRTKADACDSQGGTLFARRLVHTETFSLGESEQRFYAELLRYLQDGYDLAEKQGRQGRALGFVMTVFQKIAASSFAAIRSTLERRRLVLAVREIVEQDELRNVHERDAAAERARAYIREIDGIGPGPLGDALVEERLSGLKAQVLRKRSEAEERIEERAADDGELSGAANEDAALFLAVSALPRERERIDALLAAFPRQTESKATLLADALRQIWRESPDEKIVVFATYLGTVDSIRDALDRFFPGKGVEVLKGGDHGAKTAAQKRFRRPEGPRVLVCTAAGREGINLQFARILFNYDLPWNPMDLEQRIGRIHRYGQRDTAQVYNLVAANTIEGKIYLLLEEKLRQIAATLGKVDERGQVAEDLRGQILGQLAGRLSYDKVYREAIGDPTLVRTRQELDVAMENADRARTVVFELFQDLDGFNLDDYRRIDDEGRGLARIARFLREAAPLAGYGWHDGEDGTFALEKDGAVRHFTIDRRRALKDDALDLAGLEHPIVAEIVRAAEDALSRNASLQCRTPGVPSGSLSFWDIGIDHPGGRTERILEKIGMDEEGHRAPRLENADPLSWTPLPPGAAPASFPIPRQDAIREMLHRALEFSGRIGDGATYSARPVALLFEVGQN